MAEDDFAKVYITQIPTRSLVALTQGDCDAMVRIMPLMGAADGANEQEVTLDDDAVAAFGRSRQSVMRNVRHLVELDFLRMVRRGTYMVNPLYVASQRCSWDRVQELAEAYSRLGG